MKSTNLVSKLVMVVVILMTLAERLKAETEQEWNKIIQEGKWVSGSEPTSHFQFMGRAAKTTGYAHLVFDINMAVMYQDIVDLCQAIYDTYSKDQNWMSEGALIPFKILRERCKLQAEDFVRMRTIWSTNLQDLKEGYNGAEHGWKETKVELIESRKDEVLSQDEEDPTVKLKLLLKASATSPDDSTKDLIRKTRQVVVGIIALIVSFASGIYTAVELASISSEADDATVVEHLHTDEIGIAAHDRDIKLLNATVQVLIDEVMRLKQQEKYVDMFLRLDETASLTFEKWSRVVDGLEMLTLRKISPRLIDTIAMNKAVNKVGEKIKRYGYELDIDETDDIYKFPVSYLSFKNSTVRVFVHIPIRQVGVPMDIFRYVRSPVQLTNGTYLFPQLEETYLIADSTMNTFVTMDQRSYERCTLNKGFDGCQKGDVYYTRQRDDCLLALYLGKVDDISKNCKFEFNPIHTHLAALGSNTFLIYFPTSNILELRCGDKQYQQQFSGAKQVKVPPGCTVKGPDFVVYGRIDVIVEETIILKRVIDLDKLLMVNEISTRELEDAVKDLKLLGSKEGISIEKLKLHQGSMWWGRIIKIVISGLTIAMIVIVFIVTCLCCKDRMFEAWDRMYKPKVKDRKIVRYDKGSGNIELSPLREAPDTKGSRISLARVEDPDRIALASSEKEGSSFSDVKF